MKFNWTSDEATTLGITFTNNDERTVLKNILPKLQNFKNCFKSWHHRKLTLIGKNPTVLNTFALPKLIYVLTVLPNPPNDVINDIKSAIFNFIWDGKPDKIKRTQLIQSVENGGIQLTNIDSFLNAIKCTWVKRYLDYTITSKWKLFYQKILKNMVTPYSLNVTSAILSYMKLQTKTYFCLKILSTWSDVTHNLDTQTSS
ncbi:hypothetical protein DPMN_016636 [Dreissena polymorpha]|uniref:Reverse transcriptase n=1 Tax=Dreissena polymorpha TaxID=45954 RepID=A0A9D4NA21_DREPO|nr:hypothetical protein DPMN_016636 [Dreissena polymorpha]